MDKNDINYLCVQLFHTEFYIKFNDKQDWNKKNINIFCKLYIYHNIILLQKILEYIYTGEILLTYDNVVEMLAAARQMRIPYILQLCDDLLKDVSPEKSFILLESAQRHGLDDIYQLAFKVLIDSGN